MTTDETPAEGIRDTTEKAAGRLTSLLFGMAAAGAVLVLPSVVWKDPGRSALFFLGQCVLCGVVLGFGRQGFDLLAFRVAAVSQLVWIGTPIAVGCGGPLQCFRVVSIAVLFSGMVVGTLVGLFAFPACAAWNRGWAALDPELPWRRIPRPRLWWQWVVLALIGLVVLFATPAILGIPAPD